MYLLEFGETLLTLCVEEERRLRAMLADLTSRIDRLQQERERIGRQQQEIGKDRSKKQNEKANHENEVGKVALCVKYWMDTKL